MQRLKTIYSNPLKLGLCLCCLVPQTALRVSLRLNQTLRLCAENDTNSDCCLQSLCVLQTLQVSACVGSTPQASLLIQASIHAQLFTATAGLGKTVCLMIFDRIIQLLKSPNNFA